MKKNGSVLSEALFKAHHDTCSGRESQTVFVFPGPRRRRLSGPVLIYRDLAPNPGARLILFHFRLEVFLVFFYFSNNIPVRPNHQSSLSYAIITDRTQ